MQAALEFIAIVGGGTTISVLLLQIFRRRVPSILKAEDHQIAGHFFGVLGSFYGVLLAFVVVMVWGQFTEAKVVVTREANYAGDLLRLVRSFPEPVQSNVRNSLLKYEEVVITNEWPDMAAGRESTQAWAALDDVWSAYRGYQPQTPVELQVYQLSLGRLADLSDARRMRLLCAREKVPGALWCLLILGGAAIVSFTYMFRLEHVRAQFVMTGMIATLIAFILFLVMDFDQPFSGAIRITPEVFGRELQRMHTSGGP